MEMIRQHRSWFLLEAMMGLSVSGLASGIDSDSIISQLLALEEQRIFAIQRRIAEEEVKKAAYEDPSGRVKHCVVWAHH